MEKNYSKSIPTDHNSNHDRLKNTQRESKSHTKQTLSEVPEQRDSSSKSNQISIGTITSDKNAIQEFKTQSSKNTYQSQVVIPKGQISNTEASVKDFKDSVSSRSQTSGNNQQHANGQNNLQEQLSPYSQVQFQQNSSEMKVELCFVIDATGSMGPWINSVKVKVQEIIGTVAKTYPNAEFRVGYYAYRDLDTMDEAPFYFTSNPEELEKALAKVKLMSGKDAPEDINGALQKTLKMDWQSEIKIVAHFTDAPCHGTEFHDFPDFHPKPKSDMDWGSLFSKMQMEGIQYNFFELDSKNTRKMTEKFKQIWENALKKSSKKVNYRAKFSVYKVMDTKDLIKNIIFSTEESIQHSLKSQRNDEGHSKVKNEQKEPNLDLFTTVKNYGSKSRVL